MASSATYCYITALLPSLTISLNPPLMTLFGKVFIISLKLHFFIYNLWFNFVKTPDPQDVVTMIVTFTWLATWPMQQACLLVPSHLDEDPAGARWELWSMQEVTWGSHSEWGRMRGLWILILFSLCISHSSTSAPPCPPWGLAQHLASPLKAQFPFPKC